MSWHTVIGGADALFGNNLSAMTIWIRFYQIVANSLNIIFCKAVLERRSF